MITRTSLELYFNVESGRPELVASTFRSPLLEAPARSIRADSPLRGLHIFKWTTSLHALSLFFVQAALTARSGASGTFVMEGASGTPASSIGFACSKTRLWLCSLFGVDSRNRSLLRRALYIANARGWNPGPTRIALRETFLSPHSVTVFCEGVELRMKSDLEMLSTELENCWQPGTPRHSQTVGIPGGKLAGAAQLN